MTLASIVVLLQAAFLLLTMAQAPNVPPALKTNAVSVANQAISAATQALRDRGVSPGSTAGVPALPPVPIQTSTPNTTPQPSFCSPLPLQTQTKSCPTGQTGSISQTRTSTCAVGASAPTWGDWQTASNTCTTPQKQYSQISSVQSLSPIGQYASQYSPWVMHEPGWGNYLMYYCKNTELNGVYRDRIWRTENWGDGKTGWVNDQIVLEAPNAQSEEDLSCSPTVAINGSTWHMYYVAANRGTPGSLYLYHATAQQPWTTWTNRERVKGIPQPFTGYMDTPSAVSESGRITLYFVGSDYGLYRTTSDDGVQFANPIKTDAPSASHGRVTRSGNMYYYVFSKNSSNLYAPPTSVYLATSQDGIHFGTPQFLFSASETGWDGDRVWSPHTLVENDTLQIYYAGNSGTYDWWGSNTAIGVRTFK